MRTRLMTIPAIILALLTPTAAAFACNGDQLDGDLKFCLVDFNHLGRAMLLDGASEKDAVKLDKGFRVCQTGAPGGGNAALNNWGNCTDAQNIDHARQVTSKM